MITDAVDQKWIRDYIETLLNLAASLPATPARAGAYLAQAALEDTMATMHPIDKLKQNISHVAEMAYTEQLVKTGRFHHATARTVGVPMIYVYKIAEPGDSIQWHGYSCAAALPDTPIVQRYFASLRHGVSVGAYGQG